MTSYNILYVEDYEPAAITLDYVFKDLGYTSSHAASGAEALKLYNENAYDIIFLDIHLPDMSGYEIAQKFRAHKNYKDNVIIIGHSADIDTIDRDLSNVFDFVTTKNFDPAEIKRKILKWMKK